MTCASRAPWCSCPLHYALRAGTMGRFDEAEGLNSHSAEIGRELRGSTSDLAGSAQLLMLRLLQGRLPELEQPLRTLAASRPEMVGYACALAAMLSQAGRSAEAQAELERLTASGLDGFPKDCTHLLMLALIGDVAAELGDAARARQIYDWLMPYSGRWVVSAGASAVLARRPLAGPAGGRRGLDRCGAQPHRLGPGPV